VVGAGDSIVGAGEVLATIGDIPERSGRSAQHWPAIREGQGWETVSDHGGPGQVSEVRSYVGDSWELLRRTDEEDDNVGLEGTGGANLRTAGGSESHVKGRQARPDSPP
jgi:hypothetical protein